MKYRVPDNFDPNDLPAVADWIELNLIAGDIGDLSIGRVIDHLSDASLLPQGVDDGLGEEVAARDDDGFDSTRQYAAYEDQLLAEFEARARALGDACPYDVAGREIRGRGVAGDWVAYLGLLVWNAGMQFECCDRVEKNHDFRTWFEWIVEAAMKGLFGGVAIRFANKGEVEGTTAERVAKLGESLSLTVNDLSDLVDTTDNDVTLDVVCRARIGGDKRQPGSLYFLVNCATGKNWKGKRGEPVLARWQKFFQWDAVVVSALAVPWTFASDRQLRRAHEEGNWVVVDGRRLAAGSPDNHLESSVRREVEDWIRGECLALQEP